MENLNKEDSFYYAKTSYRKCDNFINNINSEPVAIAACFLAAAVVSGAVVLDVIKFPINKINQVVRKVKHNPQSQESNF